MNKIIVFSTDSYTDLTNEGKTHFASMLDRLIINGDKVLFTAKYDSKVDVLKGINIDGKNILFRNRNGVKALLKQNEAKKHYFIVVGNREHDLFMASANKLFYIVPNWCSNFDERVLNYGVKVNNLSKLEKLINVIENQSKWFYRLDLDEKTTVLSLTNANSFTTRSAEEKEMIDGFRSVLKYGDKQYYEVLLYHFLAAISNNAEFREINDWAIFPSSGLNLNEDMWEFKEKARELMNGRKKQPILLRHTKTWKSHESYKYNKDRLPCDRHFDSIVINNIYKDKLEGRTICVFDDYLTNGTSFEAARNLLIKEGAKKIFFVSLGKFHRNSSQQYLQQNYSIKGDVCSSGYSYRLLDSKWHKGSFDNEAITEIEQLHNIMFG
ncbi:MAG: phosphoribosyltransferase [Bacillota bacterium]|nr:phosphoribosyltransferase [Bacillota bacterium]